MKEKCKKKTIVANKSKKGVFLQKKY